MGKPLYNIQLSFDVTEQTSKEVKIIKTYNTDVEGFEVIGGSVRFIMADGRNGIGDADIMSEFYQARQFRNINLVKVINRETLAVDKLYYLKLSFDFTLVVQSLMPSSRFRSMQLNAKNAKLVRPPDRGDRSERLYFKFSDPEIFYSYNEFNGSSFTKVKEQL